MDENWWFRYEGIKSRYYDLAVYAAKFLTISAYRKISLFYTTKRPCKRNKSL